MSLSWSFKIKKDEDNKVIEVDGKTTVGHSTVKAVVKPVHIEVTFSPATLRMPNANHFKELASVLDDLQGELKQ